MIEHTSPISGIASFSNQYISTAGYDNQVILWDAQSKQAIGRGSHDHLANQCRFSSDGRYLVSSSSDYTARVWEVPSMRLKAVLSGHQDDVESIAIHDDNHTIATCSRDHTIRIYNPEGNLLRTLIGHTQDVISVEWMEHSNILISSSDDGTVKRWNGETGELLNDIDLGGSETDTVVITKKGVIFAANDDGQIISICPEDNTDLNNKNLNNNQQKAFDAHKAGIKRLVYSKESNALVSLSYDRSVKIWSIINDDALILDKSTNIPGIVWPRSCCFIGRDQLAFATFGSSYATLDCNSLKWDLSSINPTQGINAVINTEQATVTIGDAGIVHHHSANRTSKAIQTVPSLCNFLIDFNGHILTGGQSGEIFNAISGEMIHQHHSPLNCGTVYQINNTCYAAIGAYTGDVIVLKQNDLGHIVHAETVLIQDNAIKGLCNDGTQLFSVSATGQAAFHHLNGFDPLNIVPNGHDKISNGCAVLGPNQFASVSRDLKLRIWNHNNCQSFDTPLSFSIKCIAAIPDKGIIAIGSYGGQIAIFDANTLEWTHQLRPTTAGISNICCKVDHSGFIASSYDGKLHTINI